MISEAPDQEAGRARRVALVLPPLVLLALLAGQLLLSLALNDGRLIYSLDDAYVHLAFSENLIHGHFGINPGEPAAPSSSILWPLMLAPFTLVSWAEWVPFVVNCLCATATLMLCTSALTLALRPGSDARLWRAVTILAVLSIPAINLVGLVFTGMEHSLQILLTVALVQGVISAGREGRAGPWLYVLVVAGPLVRYESAALSAAALAWLFWGGYRRGALVCALVLVSLLAAYSALLLSLGLPALPTSVLAKTTLLAPHGGLEPVLRDVYRRISLTPGLLMSLGAVALCAAALRKARPSSERRLAGCFAGALVLHVVFGRFGWNNRYEIYAWCAGLLVALYVWREPLRGWLSEQSALRTAVIGLAFVGLSCRDYVIGLVENVWGMNNCYQQQYQMHRFATEYVRGPVAVNDLGWVSWRNDEYVLDLWGLGSREALDARRKHADSKWMGPLAVEHGVRVAMIYDKWFHGLPDEWVRVGELRMSGIRVTPDDKTVAFYALDEAGARALARPLREFEATLPKGASFVFER